MEGEVNINLAVKPFLNNKGISDKDLPNNQGVPGQRSGLG